LLVWAVFSSLWPGAAPVKTASTSKSRRVSAIRKSAGVGQVRGAEGRWERGARDGRLKMLGVEADSWDGLKQRVADHWDVVMDAAVRRLGEEVRGELETLRDRLNDDKVAREVVAPALLLIQAERLGVNEITLKYFGAVVSGAIDGDGHVSAALKKVELSSGEYAVALLWKAALAAYGIKAEVKGAGVGFNVVASSDDAVKLARLYFRYGPPCLREMKEFLTTSWLKP
jgi:hypothetical protein